MAWVLHLHKEIVTVNIYVFSLIVTLLCTHNHPQELFPYSADTS